jgi:hypothetical protein
VPVVGAASAWFIPEMKDVGTAAGSFTFRPGNEAGGAAGVAQITVIDILNQPTNIAYYSGMGSSLTLLRGFLRHITWWER